MKKKTPFAVLAGTLLTAAVIAPVPGFAAQAEAELEAGLYFTSTEGEQNLFYTFAKWDSLSEVEKSNLVTKYNHTNIQIYVSAMNKIATLDAAIADGSFDSAATDFVDGDIAGTFNNAATGEDFTVGNEVVDLTVESVSAINGNQVTVTLTGVEGEVPASAVKVSDSNGAVYAVTSVVAGATEGEYLVNLGTAVDGKGTLTVEVNGTSATKAFDTTLVGVTLDIAVADDDATLLANGADNTIITIKVLKDGELNEAFKGAVKFQSLKGAKFAKEEVAFDKGIATVQVNSISSATEVLDTIIATISDAENAEAVGIQTRINLKYTPENANEDTNAKVFLTYAESNSASNVFIKFNEKVNFEKLRADFLTDDVNFTIKSGVGTPSANTITNTEIHDIVKIDDNTVKIALTQAGALIDNSVVTVEVDDIRTSTGLVQKSNVQFNLVDSVAPTALGIKTIDYRTLEVQFSEAINSVDAEVVSNWVLNGTRLTAADVTTLEVGRYDIDGNFIVSYEGTKDNRNYATIVLSAAGAEKYKAEGKNNLLQAYNITDFAGLTDLTGQNKATTQEFVFVTPAKPVGPVATLTLDSVEQYKLAFDTTVVDKDGGTLDLTFAAADATGGVAIAGEVLVERLVNDVWVPFKEDEIELNTVGSTYYLELLKDWTVIHDTDGSGINYYTPKYDKVRVTVKKGEVKSLRTDALLAADYQKELDLELDVSSPTFTAEQTTNAAGALQASVTAKFNEPIKFPATGTITNAEGDTESQQQAAQAGVPTPTFEFVSEDKKTTLEGVASTLAQDDKSFIITPKDPSKLVAGKWTVIIRSISDDVGNTAATLTSVVDIKAAASASGKPEIIWAAAVDNVDVVLNGTTDEADSVTDNELGDVVFIQYGTEMSLDAIRSNIYQINDKNLPEGVSITGSEVEYETGFTGTLVKITLPHTFLGTVAQNYGGTISTPNMLNVNKRLTDDKGTTIIGASEVQLTYSKAGYLTVIDYDFLVDNHSALTFENPATNNAAADALQDALDDANLALGTVSASTSAYTTAGGLAADAVYTDVEAAETALDALVTTGTDTAAILAATTVLTDAVTALDDATTVLVADAAIEAAKLAIGNSYEFVTGTVLADDNSVLLKTELDLIVSNADITLAVTKTDDDNYSVEISHVDGGTPVTETVAVTVAP